MPNSLLAGLDDVYIYTDIIVDELGGRRRETRVQNIGRRSRAKKQRYMKFFRPAIPLIVSDV